MLDLTFLTKSQATGIIGQLPAIKIWDHCSAARMTDFAVLLGGEIRDPEYSPFANWPDDRTGYYWTKNSARKGFYDFINIVMDNGGWGRAYDPRERYISGRLLAKFENVNSVKRYQYVDMSEYYSKDPLRKNLFSIEFGEYPQMAVKRELQLELEDRYRANSLNRTGNKYTTDSRRYTEKREGFLAQEHIEYEYNGKKYVRVKANFGYVEWMGVMLSNKCEYHIGDYVWVEVEPVKWIVDKKTKTMITYRLLFAGVRFHSKRIYKTKDFNKTEIKQFIDNYLTPELFQGKTVIHKVSNNKSKVVNDKQVKEEIVIKEEQKKEEKKLPTKRTNYELEIKGIKKINSYEKILEQQAELISQQLSKFVETKSELTEQELQLKKSIEDIGTENIIDKIICIFKNKRIEDKKIDDKKSLLEELKKYLDEREKSLQQKIGELAYIRNMVASYISKANEYKSLLNDIKNELDKEILNKDYKEIDVRVYDDKLKQEFISDKITYITSAITKMLQQYESLTLQISTYTNLLNNINLAHNTTTQSYMNFALSNDISKEKNGIEILGELKELFNNISTTSEEDIIKNLEIANNMPEPIINYIEDNESKEKIKIKKTNNRTVV